MGDLLQFPDEEQDNTLRLECVSQSRTIADITDAVQILAATMQERGYDLWDV